MNPEVYSEWLRRAGHQVFRTASSYWHDQGMRVFKAFPYHWRIQPGKEELRELMLRHRFIGLRYSMPPEVEIGTPSYHAVYNRADYDFESLSAWARKNVRRGLRECRVEPISFERYVRDGWEMRIDTLARQDRHLKESQEQWQQKYSAAADLPGFEVWAAQVGSRLAATLVIFRMDDWFYMVYQQCHRDFLRAHAPNALSFAVTQDLIRRPGVRGVFYGLQSLDAPESVDEFKFRMGYEAQPVKQRICFHPAITPFVNRATHAVVKS